MYQNFEVVVDLPIHAGKKAKQWKFGEIANDKSTCALPTNDA